MKFFLFFFIFCSPLFLSAQQWEWVRNVNGVANDYTSDLFVDDSGYVYATGRNKEGVTFEDDTNPYTPTNYGHTDAFLAKYTNDGALVWGRLIGGSDPDWGWGVTADLDGNVYFTGEFDGTATFGSETFVTNGSRDCFISKLDKDGNFIWTEVFGGAGLDKGKGIDVDAAGNVYATGFIYGQVSIGGTTVGTDNITNAYMVKLDPDGNFIHVDDIQPDVSYGYKIQCDDSGYVYLSGELLYNNNVADYLVTGPTTLSWRDGYIAKLDTAFNCLWVNTMNGLLQTGAEAFDLNESAVMVTGYYTHETTFSDTTLTYNGVGAGAGGINAARDAYVAKYDLDGNRIWVKGFGGSSYDYGYDIKVNEEGDFYICGVFEDTVNFDGFQLISAGGMDQFIAKGDADGNILWVKQHSSTIDIYAYANELDHYENLFVGGMYEIGSSDFDGIMKGYTAVDAYIGKLTQHPSPEYVLDYSTNCDNDTVKIETSAITSPLSYQFNLNQSNSWIDSNAYCFVYDGSDLTGEIIVSNNIYDDTLSINEIINIPTPINLDLGADIETCDSSGIVLQANLSQNSYLWSTSETADNITVFTSGEYSVEVIDSSGCSVNDTIQVSILDCSSFDEQQTVNAVYYHNNKVVLNGEKIGYDVQVLNLEGKLIARWTNAIEVDVSEFTAGLYILQINENHQQFKFVVTPH